jgi:hypothetical protein
MPIFTRILPSGSSIQDEDVLKKQIKPLKHTSAPSVSLEMKKRKFGQPPQRQKKPSDPSDPEVVKTSIQPKPNQLQRLAVSVQ